MSTRTIRKAAAFGLVPLTAFAMVACSPPNEQPSDQKVDTATSQDAASLQGEGQIAATEATGAPNVVEAEEAASATETERENAQTNADGTPFFLDCDNNTVAKPNRIVLNCMDQDDFAEDIEWDEWGEDIATGKGTRNYVGGDRVKENVQVVVSSPEVVDGKLVFTQVSVDGDTFNPRTKY